ncbi:MAG: UDP-N-acetylglucosamine--N-acetylmuramyl-(pentapeptide) pyrophosphoryl-undecaprenol N-acetylglucosamine transferase, partial [Microcoleus sp. SIO2G3]|nr:UDP-N-acetylglucosamine--N-acetylmuramyl-(pentapeptide) pyrophosphoryl-undecaprenol N-acetylglucosamine transferase [Microcoleus sp. SIO2G3]
QTYNAAVFDKAGAAIVFQQADLTAELLTQEVLDLLEGDRLDRMKQAATNLAVVDSAQRLATLIRQQLESRS